MKKRIVLLSTLAAMLAAAMALSGVAQAAPTIDTKADAKCLAEAAKTVQQPGFNPADYIFHGGADDDGVVHNNGTFYGQAGGDNVGVNHETGTYYAGEGDDHVQINNGTYYGQEGSDSVDFNHETGTVFGGADDDHVQENYGTFYGQEGGD